jgi:AcrR family transcriptional regulator
VVTCGKGRVMATKKTTKGRPRNAESTKQRLLAAATAEFSEHGFAGARIDRIAERAGTNKRMIYAYFGDKDQLLEAVMQIRIAELGQALRFTAEDLGETAAARFDYMLANPDVRRLAAWRIVERAQPTRAERESYRTRVAAIAAAQRAGRVNAVDIFAMVLSLTDSWLSAPPALQAASGGALDARRLAEHRKALIEVVRLITEPSRKR